MSARLPEALPDPYAIARDFLRAFGEAAKSFWFSNRFNDCAAISYYALLSIVPLIGLVIVVTSQFVGVTADEIETVLRQGGVLVPQFGETLHGAVNEMLEYRTSIGLVSLVVTVWFASLVFGSIQTAFDRIFQTFHPPLWGFMKPRVAALAAALILIVGFFMNSLLTLVRSIEAPFAVGIVGALERGPLLGVLGALGSLAVDIFIFMLILYTLPPRRLHDWRMVIPAALVGTVGWRSAQYAFGFYLGYMSNNLTFSGSAGAAVIFMLWIYYAALVLLFSAELLAALDKARQRQQAPA